MSLWATTPKQASYGKCKQPLLHSHCRNSSSNLCQWPRANLANSDVILVPAWLSYLLLLCYFCKNMLWDSCNITVRNQGSEINHMKGKNISGDESNSIPSLSQMKYSKSLLGSRPDIHVKVNYWNSNSNWILIIETPWFFRMDTEVEESTRLGSVCQHRFIPAQTNIHARYYSLSHKAP